MFAEILVWKYAVPPVEIHPSWKYVGEFSWDRWIYRVPVYEKGKKMSKLKNINSCLVSNTRMIVALEKELRTACERIFHVEQNLSRKASVVDFASLCADVSKLQCKKHIWSLENIVCRTIGDLFTFRCLKCKMTEKGCVSDLSAKQRNIVLASGLTVPKEKK